MLFINKLHPPKVQLIDGRLTAVVVAHPAGLLCPLEKISKQFLMKSIKPAMLMVTLLGVGRDRQVLIGDQFVTDLTECIKLALVQFEYMNDLVMRGQHCKSVPTQGHAA